MTEEFKPLGLAALVWHGFRSWLKTFVKKAGVVVLVGDSFSLSGRRQRAVKKEILPVYAEISDTRTL